MPESTQQVQWQNWDQNPVLLVLRRLGFTYLMPVFSCRPQAGPSGLSFLLVAPLQRITKYPLLLQKILENTVPDASAYPVLQRAASALQDVNTNINEYKRRKEVGKGSGVLGAVLVERF